VSPGLRRMFSLGSGPQLPEHVRAALRGERPLAACRAHDGSWVVGTRDRLHLFGETTRVLPWEQVHRADWDDEKRRLVVVPVSGFGEPVVPHAVVLEDAADLLGLVRERVSASVVLQLRVAMDGERGFAVFGRRPPGGGSVTWGFELDEGVDPDDPEVRRRMDEALTDARGQLGLPPG
jgi:hypothetical protein